jgi:hypothetical protein
MHCFIQLLVTTLIFNRNAFCNVIRLLMIMSIYGIFLNIFCQHKGERYLWLKMA